MKKQGAFHGAVILTVAGIIVKGLGALFKIPLGALLGPEGNGIFSIAYNLYAFLFVVATAGLPVATSKTVAELRARGEDATYILKKAAVPFATLGAVFSVALFLTAPYLSDLMGATGARYAISAIAPAIFFVSVSALLRGFFQGHENMMPTAISEVIEAGAKLFFGILCAYILMKSGKGVSIIAAGATLGVSIGALFSALFLTIRKRCFKNAGGSKPQSGMVKRLVKTAVPITLGASITSLSNLIDSGLIMNILGRLGYSSDRALWAFGAYNYSTTVFNLPGFLVTTLGISLIPTVTASRVMGKFRETSAISNASLKMSAAISGGAAGGMMALATPIIAILYGNVGENAIELAGNLLKILSFAVPTLAISSLCASVLQALGDVKKPMYAMAIGACVKVFFNFLLIGIPGINIYGAAVSTVLSYGVTCALNMLALKKKRSLDLSVSRILLAPIICTGVTALGTKFAFSAFSTQIGHKLALFPAIMCGILLWGACVMLFKIVTKVDIKLLFAQKSITIF